MPFGHLLEGIEIGPPIGCILSGGHLVEENLGCVSPHPAHDHDCFGAMRGAGHEPRQTLQRGARKHAPECDTIAPVFRRFPSLGLQLDQRMGRLEKGWPFLLTRRELRRGHQLVEEIGGTSRGRLGFKSGYRVLKRVHGMKLQGGEVHQTDLRLAQCIGPQILECTIVFLGVRIGTRLLREFRIDR